MKEWIKKILDSIRGSEEFSDLKTSSLRDLLNGDIFTKCIIQKQYGLLILIAVLMFFYVDNRYSCESLVAKQAKLKKDIQDVKYESMTISAELMRLSRQSSVINMVNERGLEIEESPSPPVFIVDSTEKK